MRPLTVNMYWGGQILYNPYTGVYYDPPQPAHTIHVRERLSYIQLFELICSRIGDEVDRSKVKVFYRFPDVMSSMVVYRILRLEDDDCMETLFETVNQVHSSFVELYIEFEPSVNGRNIAGDAGTGPFTALLKSFPTSQPFGTSNAAVGECSQSRPLPNSDVIHRTPVFAYDRMHEDNYVDFGGYNESDYGDADDGEYVGGGDGSDVGADGGDEDFYIDQDEEREGSSSDDEDRVDIDDLLSDSDFGGDRSQSLDAMFSYPRNPRVLAMMRDYGGAEEDLNSSPTARGDRIPVYDPRTGDIRLGMRFHDKPQLVEAISHWSMGQNREHRVVDSKKDTWAAKCREVVEERGHCQWQIRVTRKKTHRLWEITKLADGHTCMGANRSAGNSNWTSAMIARRIRHQIEVNPAYTVKSVRAQVKNETGVDISYKKAWYARQKAIDYRAVRRQPRVQGQRQGGRRPRRFQPPPEDDSYHSGTSHSSAGHLDLTHSGPSHSSPRHSGPSQSGHFYGSPSSFRTPTLSTDKAHGDDGDGDDVDGDDVEQTSLDFTDDLHVDDHQADMPIARHTAIPRRSTRPRKQPACGTGGVKCRGEGHR